MNHTTNNHPWQSRGTNDWQFDRSSLPDPGGYYQGEFANVRGYRNARVACCFHGGKHRNLSLNLDTGAFHCFVCGESGGDIIEFHRKRYGLGFMEAVADLCGADAIARKGAVQQPTFRSEEPNERLRDWLVHLLNQAHVASPGDLVHQYLIMHRGIALSRLPVCLRLHPGLDYRDDDGTVVGQFPAMLASVRNLNCEIVAVHRTFLSATGQKAPVPNPKKLTKAVFRGATKGAAIRLFQATGILAVAEGIETALAVHTATGFPVWATVSAGGMEWLEVPPCVNEVIICTDLDRSGRGEQAANVLAGRMMRAGKQVKIAIPPGPLVGKGVDWADVLAGGSNE